MALKRIKDLTPDTTVSDTDGFPVDSTVDGTRVIPALNVRTYMQQNLSTTYGCLVDLVIDVTVLSPTNPRPTIGTVPAGKIWIPERTYAIAIQGQTMVDNFSATFYGLEPGGPSDRSIGSFGSTIIAAPEARRSDVSAGGPIAYPAGSLIKYAITNVGPIAIPGTTVRFIVSGVILGA